MIDRNFTLNRIKSRALSPAEFNYEVLTAPPLYSMFTPEDIQQLNYYATSPKYSANLKEKYDAIDKIMKNRGFEKLVSGTNRVAYRPLFADNFIVKVAYDTVALQDSIREYRNQFLLKPFCTKVFEVSACGTIGVFEKVNPVTSRKEYISMAADIFTLLSDYVIGKYVIDDIGTEYYQNIGFRYGFGPVILDFPYVYEVDPKKIWCNKPDYNDPTGYCNGPIDYDFGFNKLMCMKCGAIYKPFELAKKIEYKSQFINESEEYDMKISLSGGTLGRNEEITTGDFRNPVKSIASNILNKKVEKTIKEEKKVEEPKVEEKTEDDVPMTVNGVAPVVEKKDGVNPFKIDETKEFKGDPGYINETDSVKLLQEVVNIYNSSDDKKDVVENVCAYFLDIFKDNIEVFLNMVATVFRSTKDIHDNQMKTLVNNCSTPVKNQLLRLILASGYSLNTEINGITKKDGEFVFSKSDEVINNNTGKEVYTFEADSFNIPAINFASEYPEEFDDVETVTPIDYYSSEYAEEFDDVEAVTVNKKDLIADAEGKKVIVIRNNDGKYLTLNDKIVAINKIDSRVVGDSKIVGSEWYNEATAILDNIKQAPTGALPEENIVEESSGEEESGEE